MKVISAGSVGLDYLEIDEIKSKGVRIGYTPGVGTEPVAEFALALLLTVSRRIVEASLIIRRSKEFSKFYGSIAYLKKLGCLCQDTDG